MSSALRQWLDRRGLAQYGDRFEADDIDLDVVPSLSDRDLEKLGVSMGHRKRLLKAIAELTGPPASPVASDRMAAAPAPAKHLADRILHSKSALEGERKQVTVLFADVKGSMELAEQLDAEAFSQIMQRFFRILSDGVERFEGFVDKFTGDGIMALFGAPIAHEDHAQRASLAAWHPTRGRGAASENGCSVNFPGLSRLSSGSSWDDFGAGVAVDDGGNVFLTGRFVVGTDFGGGLLSGTSANTYVVKLAGTNGAHLWSRTFSSNDADEGLALAVDGSGNPIVTGRFQRDIDFGGGVLSSALGYNMFVTKLSGSTGTYLWARQAGGTYPDLPQDIVIDASGDVIVTGTFDQSTNLGGATLSSSGLYDAFVVKYRGTTGAHVWSRALGGTGYNEGLGVAVDRATGDAVVTGYFEGTLNPGGETLVSAGARDTYVVELSAATGGLVWSERFGSPGNDQGAAVTVNGTGAVAHVGFFTNTVDFGTGPLSSAGGGDVFVRYRMP